MHWIMTATLAICIIIAATVISIGIARAGVFESMDRTGASAGLSVPAAALFVLSLMAVSGFSAIGARLLPALSPRERV